MPNESKLPDWLSDNPPAASKHRQTPEELDEIVAGTEKGISDTHAWKDMVRRVGLKEARRILKLGLLARQLPDRNPKN
jgi:pilus assembly protein TadC